MIALYVATVVVLFSGGNFEGSLAHIEANKEDGRSTGPHINKPAINTPYKQ